MTQEQTDMAPHALASAFPATANLWLVCQSQPAHLSSFTGSLAPSALRSGGNTAGRSAACSAGRANKVASDTGSHQLWKEMQDPLVPAA